MARDVVLELERYGEYADLVAPALSLNELTAPQALDRRAVIRAPRPISLRRGVLVAVSAAVVVLALIGGAVMLSGVFDQDETPVVTQPPPPTASLPGPTAPPPRRWRHSSRVIRTPSGWLRWTRWARSGT